MASIVVLALMQGTACRKADDWKSRFDEVNVTEVWGEFVDGSDIAFAATDVEKAEMLRALREATPREWDPNDEGVASLRIWHIDHTMTRVAVGKRQVHVERKVYDKGKRILICGNDGRLLAVLKDVKKRRIAEGAVPTPQSFPATTP